MNRDELGNKYIDMCDSKKDCMDCEYYCDHDTFCNCQLLYGYQQGKSDQKAFCESCDEEIMNNAIEEFERLDLKIKIGDTVMLMADSKFYEAERKKIKTDAIYEFISSLDYENLLGDTKNFNRIMEIAEQLLW